MPWSSFFEYWLFSQLFHSPFTFIKRLFCSFLFSAIRVISFEHHCLLIFLLAILIPTCASSFNLAFCMMYSAHKLNKQGENIQPGCTPFPTWNKSVVPCPVLTVASWRVHRVLRRQVKWFGISISWRIYHSLCDPHSQRVWHSHKAEVDVFLELSWSFCDPMDVGSLISVFSAFPKSRLNIWKFLMTM